MDYYLIYICALTGVPEQWLGITEHVATMRTLEHQFNVRHEGCRNYNKTDHECYRCDKRLVVDTIQEVHK